jgi:hypothetical protein
LPLRDSPDHRPRPTGDGAAALAVVALFGVGGAAAAPDVDGTSPSLLTFSDPSGDAANAPDLSKVAVAGDARTGMIAVSVTASAARLPGPDGTMRPWSSCWTPTAIRARVMADASTA